MFSTTAAAGDYDGVWIFDFEVDPNSDYFVAYQRGNTLLLVSAYRELDGWEAFIGDFTSATSADVSSLVNDNNSTVSLSINFTSTEKGTVTVNACAPQEICDGIPVGVPLGVNKIF